jgi:hypothetical protein
MIMKKLIMAMITMSSMAVATAPVFALKAPVTGAKEPAAACTKAKSAKISHKPSLKNKAEVVGLKKTK